MKILNLLVVTTLSVVIVCPQANAEGHLDEEAYKEFLKLRLSIEPEGFLAEHS